MLNLTYMIVLKLWYDSSTPKFKVMKPACIQVLCSCNTISSGKSSCLRHLWSHSFIPLYLSMQCVVFWMQFCGELINEISWGLKVDDVKPSRIVQCLTLHWSKCALVSFRTILFMKRNLIDFLLSFLCFKMICAF